MGRNGYRPILSWAEMVMGRNDQLPNTSNSIHLFIWVVINLVVKIFVSYIFTKSPYLDRHCHPKMTLYVPVSPSYPGSPLSPFSPAVPSSPVIYTITCAGRLQFEPLHGKTNSFGDFSIKHIITAQLISVFRFIDSTNPFFLNVAFLAYNLFQ